MNHQRYEGRMDADSAALAHLEGVIRTQAILIKEGKVSA